VHNRILIILPVISAQLLSVADKDGQQNFLVTLTMAQTEEMWHNFTALCLNVATGIIQGAVINTGMKLETDFGRKIRG